jgi:hypothetical protein
MAALYKAAISVLNMRYFSCYFYTLMFCCNDLHSKLLIFFSIFVYLNF